MIAKPRSEFEILDFYKSDMLDGIYVTDSCFYIPLRITGLGVTRRLDDIKTLEVMQDVLKKLGETNIPDNLVDCAKVLKAKNMNPNAFSQFVNVDRKFENFADEKVLPRYIGLPILLDHPEDAEGNAGLLDFSTFEQNKIIGTIVDAFNKDDAVWGIGKIYDLSVLDKLKDFKSTSPAIVSSVLHCIEGDDPDEEFPLYFNHLALVQNGHWDQINENAMDAKIIRVEDDSSQNLSIISPTLDNKVGLIQKEGVKNMDKNIKADEDKSLDDLKIKADGANLVGSVNPKADEDDIKNKIDDDDEVTKVVDPKADEDDDIKNKIDDDDDIKNKIDDDDDIKNKIDDDDDIKNKIDDDDEIIEVDDDEVLEVINPKTDDDDIKDKIVDEDDEITEIIDPKTDDDDEVIEVVEPKNEDEIESDVECDEDKESAKLIDSMRKLIDRSAVKDLRMPYIKGRMKPSAVIKSILSKNLKYVDRKYRNVIVDSRRNYRLCVDAFNGMIDNVELANQRIRSHRNAEKAKARGFVVTENPNVSVDRNF